MFNVSPTDSNQALHYSYRKDLGTFLRRLLISFCSQEDMMRLLKNLLHHYCFMVVVLYMAYNVIHKNMETALLSLRTVQRAVHSQYHSLSV